MRTRTLALLASALLGGCDASTTATDLPPPPQLPRDFQWEGRWIVRDLGIDVPFTWQGSDGNTQMIAGGEEDAIHFTNLIYDDQLYTLTYRWPNTVPPLPSNECVCIGRLTVDELNLCLSSARYVGAETLKEREPRHVHHFRVSVVFGDPETKPAFVRAPIMEGDFYVDEKNPSEFWKVLHFGFQNLLDPALDEWAVMHTLEETAGRIALPVECAGKCKGDDPAFPPGFFCK